MSPVLPIGSRLENARIYELEQLLVELATQFHVVERHSGLLALRIGDSPLPQRQQTTVTLTNLEMGGQFDQKLFQFIDPRIFQPGANG